MEIRFTKSPVKGVDIVAKMPALADLTTAYHDNGFPGMPDFSPGAAKALVKSCIPEATFKALERRAPASFVGVARTIFKQAAGGRVMAEEFGIDVAEFDIESAVEGEVPDDVVREWTKRRDWAIATFTKEEDEMLREVYALKLEIHGKTLFYLFRFPRTVEVDKARKRVSFEAAKAFLETTCLYPLSEAKPIDHLVKVAPVVLMFLQNFLFKKAGDGDFDAQGE